MKEVDVLNSASSMTWVKGTFLVITTLIGAVSSGWSNPNLPYPQSDIGIFSDLDPRVTSVIPEWLTGKAATCRKVSPEVIALELGGYPVKAYPLTKEVKSAAYWEEMRKAGVVACAAGASPWSDMDRDGIPDTLDVMYGARKTVLNGAAYGGPYRKIKYPGGDIPRAQGVCTDVIIRALRNAGYDLQKALIQDMDRAPKAYGLRGRRPNRSIEHRRVRRQIVFFKRAFRSLPTHFTPQLSGRDVWLPGDIVFMDTLPKAGPDHVGIVSDRTDSHGRPLIINNWDNGHRTADMALLGTTPITHRFRITERRR